jgi:hypothetical protein
MDLLILFVLVAAVSWKASQIWHVMAFKKLLEDLGISDSQLRKLAQDHGIIEMSEESQTAEDDDPNSDLPILEVRIEQHPEGLFAYRKVDDSFIAQGKDREGLMENLVNNLTNVRVIVHKEDGADLINP